MASKIVIIGYVIVFINADRRVRTRAHVCLCAISGDDLVEFFSFEIYFLVDGLHK